MSSIERTAYPRFAPGRLLKEQELEQFYSLNSDELRYINDNIRGTDLKFNFAVQLKSFQRLGYFPEFKNIPTIIIEHIKKTFSLLGGSPLQPYTHDKTRYRHQDRICDYLKINRWRKNQNPTTNESCHPGRHLATQAAYRAAQTMNNPADIINVVIEELIQNHYELPAFEQLNRLVKHTRSLVNRGIFKQSY